MSKGGMIAIQTALALLIAALLAAAFMEGKTNDECRKNGGVPVKTERGYTCLKQK